METWKLDRSLHQIKRDDSGPTGDQGGGRAGGFINVNIQCFPFPCQVGWHLSQLHPKQKQSSLEFRWWVGLTDAEKEGEFKWSLDHDDKTLWGNVTVEDGSSQPRCGTVDANLTLRGVDCAVAKTETATRTILCEAGGKTA